MSFFSESIQKIGKLSFTGSTLALQVPAAAGVGDGMLQEDTLSVSVGECWQTLIKALGNKAAGSQEVFEQGIGNETVDLARVLNSGFISSTTED